MQNASKSLCKFQLTLVSDKSDDGWWFCPKYRLTKPLLVILFVTRDFHFVVCLLCQHTAGRTMNEKLSIMHSAKYVG